VTRPEITGRKRRPGAKRRPRGPAIRAPPPPRGAFTIDEFCSAHGFRPTLYYALRKDGEGPTEIRVGRRVLITVEAAERWRAERTAASSNTSGDAA
jgi:hypothetical protein